MMHSFVDLDLTFGSQPRQLGARLSRIDVGRGREAMYRDQLPQLLERLAGTTRVESITASNAIEGVVVEPHRLAGLARPGRPSIRFRNRSEREFAGYRDATDEIMKEDPLETLNVPYVLHLHRLLFAHTDTPGGYLKHHQNQIVDLTDGSRKVLFTPPSPKQTEFMLPDLIARYRDATVAGAAHPLVLVGALILDFLAIHPVSDGNGRTARLITTHELLATGYGISRYVSIELRMLATKDAYYDALYASQRGWHEAQHDIWHWMDYLVSVLEDAYDDFEARVAARRGLASLSKQEQVRRYVLEHGSAVFRASNVRDALPGVSGPTVTMVLGAMKGEGLIELVPGSNRGPAATWRRR